MLITLDQILSHGPCNQFSTKEEIVEQTDFDWPKPAHGIWGLPIKPEHIFLVISRTGLIFNSTTLGHIACDIAESVWLPFDGDYSGELTPYTSIQSKRMWLDGLIGNHELSASKDMIVYCESYRSRLALRAVKIATDYDETQYVPRGSTWDTAFVASKVSVSRESQWERNLGIAKRYLR